MTIKLLVSTQRPNTEVPWTNKGNELRWHLDNQYFLDTWYQKGKLLSIAVTYSDDNLIANVILEFSDWQALDDFSVDEILLNECQIPRDIYNATVGIEIINVEALEV